MPRSERPSLRLRPDSTQRVDPAPKRLIQVETMSENPQHIKVRLVQAETVKEPYIALSHRWTPEAGSLKTKRDNIQDRLNSGIDYNSLTPSFRDAIRTTHGLGLQHVWIDSLCIVQDDKEELEKECSQMELIFSQAYCVLAAASDDCGKQGFLTRHGLQATSFTLSDSEEFTGLEILQLPPPSFSTDVLQKELNTRGWVFQERALARHTIHFASEQAFWECEAGIACESQDTGAG